MRIVFPVVAGGRDVIVELSGGEVAGLADAIAALHATGSVTADAAGPPDLVVRSSAQGFEIDEATTTERFGDRADFVSHLEMRISEAVLGRATGRLHVHAAGLALNAGCALVLGDSGAGKSSLSLAWSLGGRPLLGDDVVLVAPGGRAEAHPRPVKVDTERLTAIGLPPESTLEYDPRVDEVWVDPTRHGGWVEGSIPIRLLAVGRFVRGAPAAGSARPLPTTDALQALLRSVTGSGGVAAEDVLDRAIGVVERARTVTIRFGSSRAATDTIEAALRDACSPGSSTS